MVANNSIDKSEASVEVEAPECNHNLKKTLKVSIQYPPSIVSVTDVFKTPVDPGGAVEIRYGELFKYLSLYLMQHRYHTLNVIY